RKAKKEYSKTPMGKKEASLKRRARLNSFCCEPLSNIEGYENMLKDDSGLRWIIHHRNGVTMSRKQLKELGLYYGRPAIELIWMRQDDHMKLHNKFRKLKKEKQ
ncbi:MAG: hypothetical protein HUJ98_13580, partial [Bacteroidaceae bacterium]|nr:hypothetical protein [Bacteroidaceae bacterium]